MRQIVSAAAAVALGSTFAFAADLPVKAPVAVPVAAPLYNWSGFYVGGDAGWQGSTIGLSHPTGVLAYSPHHNSFELGGFAGYQHQFGQIVVGIEGGYMAGFGSGSLGTTPTISIFTPGGTGTAQAKLDDIWTIGGRLGWATGAAGNWLPYITGGYAAGRFGFDAQDSLGVAESARATASGGYLGVGLEWAAWRNVIGTSDLILGIEYRHYAFGAKDATGVASNGLTETIHFDPKTDVVMARASFKFGN
jgi:outer membrane immunogenic protein